MNVEISNTYLSKRQKHFELAYKSYAGGQDYISSYLVQHLRESDTHYTKRLTYAFYINFIGKIIDVLTGFVVKNISRDIGIKDDELKKNYLEEIDLYQTMNDFIKQKITDFLLTGNAFSIGDADESNRAYLHDINYLNLTDYKITKGIIEFVEVFYPGEKEEDGIFVRYEKDLITIYDSTKKKIDDMENKIGEVPFVAIKKKLSVKKAYFEDAVYTNRALFNLYNTVNKELFDTGFAILTLYTMQDDVDPETLKFVRMIPGHPEEKPEYVEPPTSHLDFTLRFVDNLIDKLLSTLSIYRSEEKDTSGISKSYDYSMMVSILVQLADVFQSFEIKEWRLLAKFDERIKPDDIKIEYKKDFDIRSLTEELDNVLKLMAIQVSDTFEKEMKKKLTTKMIEDDNTRAKIFEEIDNEPNQSVPPAGDNSNNNQDNNQTGK